MDKVSNIYSYISIYIYNCNLYLSVLICCCISVMLKGKLTKNNLFLLHKGLGFINCCLSMRKSSAIIQDNEPPDVQLLSKNKARACEAACFQALPDETVTLQIFIVFSTKNRVQETLFQDYIRVHAGCVCIATNILFCESWGLWV